MMDSNEFPQLGSGWEDLFPPPPEEAAIGIYKGIYNNYIWELLENNVW